MEVLVEQVEPGETAELRQRILRPHQTLAEMALAGDDDASTGYFAVRDPVTSDVVSTGSVRKERPPWAPGAEAPAHAPDVEVPAPATAAAAQDGDRAWRLRGMATSEDRRSEGLGRRILDAAVAYVAAAGGGLLWCSARTPAQSFYERGGFVPIGDVFEEPHIGPHVLMWRVVDPQR
jgi:GNAT superfamily N-acetyltransferase